MHRASTEHPQRICRTAPCVFSAERPHVHLAPNGKTRKEPAHPLSKSGSTSLFPRRIYHRLLSPRQQRTTYGSSTRTMETLFYGNLSATPHVQRPGRKCDPTICRQGGTFVHSILTRHRLGNGASRNHATCRTRRPRSHGTLRTIGRASPSFLLPDLENHKQNFPARCIPGSFFCVTSRLLSGT